MTTSFQEQTRRENTKMAVYLSQRTTIFMHKTLKTTGAELCFQKAGVVKVSSKCRQNPKMSVLSMCQK